MIYRVSQIILISVLINTLSIAQSVRTAQNYKERHIMDRLSILYSDSIDFHTAIPRVGRKDMTKSAYKILHSDYLLSQKDKENLDYIFKDNNEWIKYFEKRNIQEIELDEEFEYIDSTKTFYRKSSKEKHIEHTSKYFTNKKPILKYFYKTPANLFELDGKDFYFRLNPVIGFQLGNAKNDENTIFQNTRGIHLRGELDNKLYFFTSVYENQQRFLFLIERRIERDKAIPGNGFYKKYRSNVRENLNGWDFLNAEAYVGFNLTKSIIFEFGHSTHFIGNGYSSLILNDYANNYFYLKFAVDFWKIHYQSIFSELSVYGGNDVSKDLLIPKKYMAAHYFDFKATSNFSIGFYEAVVFNRENHFEFQYLNPVVFYRTIEQFIGSPDNVLIGLNTKWNIINKFQLYGQLILDEFRVDNIFSNSGWWGNKYGVQLGMKYINMFNIDHLDGQVEYNIARPFLYSHRDTIPEVPRKSIASYSHFNQPLAHPLGANFKEFVFLLQYVPIRNVLLKGRFLYSTYGENPQGENWGGNILLSSNSRQLEYGNTIGQGIHTNLSQLGLDISYQFFHNYNLDLNILYRKKDSALDELDHQTFYIGTGLRINISDQRLDY